MANIVFPFTAVAGQEQVKQAQIRVRPIQQSVEFIAMGLRGPASRPPYKSSQSFFQKTTSSRTNHLPTIRRSAKSSVRSWDL